MDFNILAVILILIVAFFSRNGRYSWPIPIPSIVCVFISWSCDRAHERMYYVRWSIAVNGFRLGKRRGSSCSGRRTCFCSFSNYFVKAGKFDAAGQNVAIGTAIALATAGLVLTMVVRTLSVVIVHQADREAEKVISKV